MFFSMKLTYQNKVQLYNEIDKILNDPIYAGQIRIIPRDQLEEAVSWLQKMINTESTRRPEQVQRYREILALLTDRLKSTYVIASTNLQKASPC